MMNNYKTVIPIGISARHVHLCKEHIHLLFGKSAELTFGFDLSQPGQFAAKERVTIKGPKGEIHNVRVLGPARSKSQVEISKTDGYAIGVIPPLRQSGDLVGTRAILITGPYGSVHLSEGLMIAQAHIHMNPNEAKEYGVVDGELVDVYAHTERPITFHKVIVRVSEQFALDMHIDTDEGNASFIQPGTTGIIQKRMENGAQQWMSK